MYNVIVVGAGWYGLAAARAYLADHPDDKMLVIEAESSCGGTWSKDRLYPGLRSNNIWGSYEYPEFPMVESVYGVSDGQHIPAAVLHRYLTDYAKHFGVFERIRFNLKVTAVEYTTSKTWKLHTTPSKGEGADEVLETEKLIMATGLTSEPNLPVYAGQETFTPKFFHAKDFCANANTVDTCPRATIVGAGKSAFDCAYAFATAKGSQRVDLIIRPTGGGPVWLCPAYVTPLKRKLEELLHTRLLSWFAPLPYGAEDGYGIVRRFLHGTWLGNMIVGAFWKTISTDVTTAHGFDKHPELKKLKPWQSAMWTGSAVGIHNYPTNFFDLVKEGKIIVHEADIDRLSKETVYLTDGDSFETDVLICATGWKKETGFKYINFDRGLKETGAAREKLIADAESQVLSTFPMLKNQPVLRSEPKPAEPFRNYRFIVPTQNFFERNIAYAGMLSTADTSVFASIQGIWISAYLDGKLRREPTSKDEITKEVMLHTQFGKWRYPCGYGANLPDFAFDSVPYVDLLMKDLGLKSHRKSSTLKDIFAPYKPADYADVVQEWHDLD